MGGGKGGGCQNVGYAYFADFAYVFADNIQEIKEFWVGVDKTWEGSITTSGEHFSAMTGKVAAMYGSNSGKSNVYFFNNQTASNPYLSNWTGYNIAYKNTAMLVFPGAFIGDNVSALPIYKIKAKNTNYWISNYREIGEDINPIHVIVDIIAEATGANESEYIDYYSFYSAARTLYNEGLGISFKMTSAKPASDWIEQILQIIDGAIILNSSLWGLNAPTYQIKLFRKEDPWLYLTSSDLKEITINRPAWSDLPTTYVFSYLSNEDGQEKSLTFVNNRLIQLTGQEKIKSFSFPMISNEITLRKVAKRIMAKYSYPLMTIKGKIPAANIDYMTPGDTILVDLQDIGLFEKEKVFRIVKLAGDTELDEYCEIELIEDIFFLNSSIDTVETGSSDLGSTFNFSITFSPNKVKIIDAYPEMANSSKIIVLTNKPNTDVLLSGSTIQTNSGNFYYGDLYVYTELNTTIPITEELNRTFEFQVKDIYGQLFEVFNNESNINNLKQVALIDSEMIAIQSIEHTENDIYTVKGILRNINNSGNTEHAIGASCWFSLVEARKITTTTVEAYTDTYNISYYNFKMKGPDTTINYSYQFTVEKPYAPQLSVPDNHDNSGNILYWRPTVQLSGANYRSPENIVGGEDENKDVGVYEIWNGDTLIDTITSEQTTIYSYDLSSQGGVTTNIKIRKVLNGYYSDFAQVDSNYIAALLQ